MNIAPSWQAQRRQVRWVRNFFLALAVMIFILPLVWSLLASLNILPDDGQTPPTWNWHPSLDNYIDIGTTSPDFRQDLITSVFVSAAATILTIAVSFLAGYALSRTHVRGIWAWTQSFLILASVPAMAYAIPLSDVVRNLHLYDTFAGVALADSAVFAPLAVYILFGYLKQIPTEFEESARLEGASVWQIVWRVALPMSAAGVAATALIVFVLNWNLLLVPMVITASHIKTIPILMTDFFKLEREIDWPSAAAVLVTSLVPLIVLVGAAHRLLEHFNLIPTQSAT